VIADVDGLVGPVHVSEVVYAEKAVMAMAPKTETAIEVKNLAECKKDWTGKGRYIIPLLKDGDNYRVAPIPRSPGFGSGAPRMYPDTAETRDQLHALRDRMPPS
jgi:hypothetical protein